MNHLADHSVLKKTLDVLDEIRMDVLGEIGDSAFADETLQHIPQIVVTGAQSSGKSSVLTQLSGVQLPQKAERCTRVATNLKLRREPTVSLTISLFRPNQQSPIEASGISDTAAAIDTLQTRAMEECGQAQFAKGYSIEVSVTGPNMPNTTLVDLPGFTSSSDEDTELVLDIVTPYLEMDNTTILHVCKGDMDYGSLLGNDVIRKYYDKVIHVFTHLDRLDESQQRSVMNSIMSGSGEPRFGILGKYSGDPKFEKAETIKLSAFRGFQDKFQYGREALIEHMENFQAQRLVERLPQTVESLNSMRTLFQERLGLIKPRSQFEVFFEAAQLPLQRFDAGLKTHMNDHQQLLIEEFIKDMQKLGLYVREGNVSRRPMAKGEEFVAGDLVINAANHNNIFMDVVVSVERTKQEGTANFTIEYVLESGAKLAPSLLCVYGDSSETILKRIKELVSRNAGLRNLANVDPHEVLDPFMEDFSHAYGKLLRTFLKGFASTFKSYLEHVFGGLGVSDMAKPVLKEIHNRVDKEFASLVTKCEDWVRDAEGWNLPPLVFTTNNHYFNSLCLASIKEDSAQARVSDDASMLIFYHKLRAYIKVQRKVITESAVKQFCLAFNVDLRHRIKHVVGNLGDMTEWIREPKAWEEERVILLRRCEILDRSLTSLQRVMG